MFIIVILSTAQAAQACNPESKSAYIYIPFEMTY